MSGHQYLSNTGNLFGDDDIDDETFLRNSRPKITHDPNYGGQKPHYTTPTPTELDEQHQMMLQKKMDIEQRTVESSARSLGILRDSEQIGIATAEELLKQREQLERTSKRLDEINTNLRFSQKHINGIKSVFSSLKNYISGKNGDAIPRMSSPTESRPNHSPLAEHLGRQTESGNREELFDNHPSTRLRGLDERSQRQNYTGEPSGSKQMNQLLEANLDEMVHSITRLKGLATNLGEEIESQNDLVSTITDKTEAADLTLNRQNKQMNKLLGNK